MCMLAGDGIGHVRWCIYAMTYPDMALFGMVWLLRVRAEMKRCAKCKRQDQSNVPAEVERGPSTSTFFTIEGNATLPSTTEAVSPGHALGPTTFCEVHGFNPPKEGKFTNNK
ncbi:hypothetical protein QE152_g4817 [Popillia japonica]|uniref:Uncharacterized protein n=1 Tax=Popillia japonica TaxID=7064 RepID=A0AAW1MZC0_POPJA